MACPPARSTAGLAWLRWLRRGRSTSSSEPEHISGSCIMPLRDLLLFRFFIGLGCTVSTTISSTNSAAAHSSLSLSEAVPSVADSYSGAGSFMIGASSCVSVTSPGAKTLWISVVSNKSSVKLPSIDFCASTSLLLNSRSTDSSLCASSDHGRGV